MAAVKQVTIWVDPELVDRIDRLLTTQGPSPIGARATRHGFVVAAVKRAVEQAEAAQQAPAGEVS